MTSLAILKDSLRNVNSLNQCRSTQELLLLNGMFEKFTKHIHFSYRLKMSELDLLKCTRGSATHIAT